jgi:hypothetical protein
MERTSKLRQVRKKNLTNVGFSFSSEVALSAYVNAPLFLLTSPISGRPD